MDLKKMIEADRAMMRRRYGIIAVLLSGFPPDTTFYSRGESGWLDNYLDDRIAETLDGCGIKSVEKVFKFYAHKYGRRCEELEFLLSPMTDYGRGAGLSNWGLDFDFRTSQKTIDLAEEMKEEIPRKDFRSLREFGLNSLYPKRPAKIRKKRPKG